MAKLTILSFIRSQWRKIPPVVKQDLSGKTVVVTGANTGLGFEASKHFASMNPARLILACRSKERGEQAIKGDCPFLSRIIRLLSFAEIEAATGYKTAELWLLDLSKFASVVEFADKFEKDGGKIDLLIANAGVVLPEYHATSDGHEDT